MGKRAKKTGSKVKMNARYVYCVGQFNGKQLSCEGIEGNPVRAVRAEDLCVLVHECEPKPYTTQDSGKANEWIVQHQNVVEKAMQELGAVIPLTFDTIFKEERQLIEFLKLNKEKIKEKLRLLEGKREFGIKIFYNENLREEIAREKESKEETEKESRGKAYFLRKKIEREINAELQEKLKKYFEEFYEKISTCGEIIVEKIKEKNMFASFSCLISMENIEKLSKILDEINNSNFKIVFTGPWPPYSFTHKIFEVKGEID